MSTHPAIDKWGRKKYNLPSNATVLIEQETRSVGYGGTYWFEEKVMAVYSVIDGKKTHLLEELYTDLAGILREILDTTE